MGGRNRVRPNRLGKLREQTGMTRGMLAEATGLAPAKVCSHEDAAEPVELEDCKRYAGVFGVYFYELYYEPVGGDNPTGQNRLKELRMKAGLSVVELSRVLGVYRHLGTAHPARIELQEAGETGLTHGEVASYARAFKVYSSELFEGVGEGERSIRWRGGPTPFDEEEKLVREAKGRLGVSEPEKITMELTEEEAELIKLFRQTRARREGLQAQSALSGGP